MAPGSRLREEPGLFDDHPLAGFPRHEAELRSGVLVALVDRGGRDIVPNGATVLRAGSDHACTRVALHV